MNETITCWSDWDYAGRPLSIYWKGEKRIVRDVLSTWRSPEGKCYRVITEDELVFQAQYLENEDRWDLEEK